MWSMLRDGSSVWKHRICNPTKMSLNFWGSIKRLKTSMTATSNLAIPSSPTPISPKSSILSSKTATALSSTVLRRKNLGSLWTTSRRPNLEFSIRSSPWFRILTKPREIRVVMSSAKWFYLSSGILFRGIRPSKNVWTRPFKLPIKNLSSKRISSIWKSIGLFSQFQVTLETISTAKVMFQRGLRSTKKAEPSFYQCLIKSRKSKQYVCPVTSMAWLRKDWP